MVETVGKVKAVVGGAILVTVTVGSTVVLELTVVTGVDVVLSRVVTVSVVTVSVVTVSVVVGAGSVVVVGGSLQARPSPSLSSPTR